MLAGRIGFVMFTAACLTSVVIDYGIHGRVEQMSPYYNYSTLTFFCLTCIACNVVMILLILTIRRVFTDELNQEMRQLVISEITFVGTFLLRVILIFVVQQNKWIDFTRDYPDHMMGYFVTIMFPTQFIVYNFLPYITLMYMHIKNFSKRTER